MAFGNRPPANLDNYRYDVYSDASRRDKRLGVACVVTLVDITKPPRRRQLRHIRRSLNLRGRSAHKVLEGEAYASLMGVLLVPRSARVVMHSDLAGIARYLDGDDLGDTKIAAIFKRIAHELFHVRNGSARYSDRKLRTGWYRACHHESRRRIRRESLWKAPPAEVRRLLQSLLKGV